MQNRTYYWEHWTDPSRWLRSRRAANLVQLAGKGELGVIIRDGDRPLRILALEGAATMSSRACARELARLGRE